MHVTAVIATTLQLAAHGLRDLGCNPIMEVKTNG
jgi:hypothetical protein